MKKVTKLNFIIAISACLMTFCIKEANAFGCTASGVGMCFTNCPNGTICCVGWSPNCESGESNGETWIDCGDGQMNCGPLKQNQ